MNFGREVKYKERRADAVAAFEYALQMQRNLVALAEAWNADDLEEQKATLAKMEEEG